MKKFFRADAVWRDGTLASAAALFFSGTSTNGRKRGSSYASGLTARATTIGFEMPRLRLRAGKKLYSGYNRSAEENPRRTKKKKKDATSVHHQEAEQASIDGSRALFFSSFFLFSFFFPFFSFSGWLSHRETQTDDLRTIETVMTNSWQTNHWSPLLYEACAGKATVNLFEV